MSLLVRTVVLALLLAIGLGTGNMAMAFPQTFLFSGDVTGVDPRLGMRFNTTQKFSGSYTFNTATDDNFSADLTFGQYTALTSLSFNIGRVQGGEGMISKLFTLAMLLLIMIGIVVAVVRLAGGVPADTTAPAAPTGLMARASSA